MIAAVMPMTGAAADEPAVVDSDGQTVVDLIVDGGTDSTTWVDIGEVQVENDGTNLIVKYVVDTGSWCLTSTAVDIDSGDGFATTKPGSPKVGKFEFKEDHDPCLTEYTETIPLDKIKGEVKAIAAHADALQVAGLDGVEMALPATADLKVIHPGTLDGYFESIVTNGGVLDDDSPYTGWCVDVGHSISPGTEYKGLSVFSSYEDLSDTNIDKPENMDLVNWLINNMNVGTLLDGIEGVVTKEDVQTAIWRLIDNTPQNWNPISEDRVAAMVAAAIEYGEGFEPGCNDDVAIVFGYDEDSVQGTVIQTTFIELGVPCEDREETAWAGVWMENEDGTGVFAEKFVAGSTWAGYFAYQIAG